MSAPQHRSRRSPVAGVFWSIVAAVIVIGVLMDSGLFEGDSADGTSGAVFGARESGRLIERLDAAAKAQGICYGWRIDSGTPFAVPPVTPSYSGTFTPGPLPSALASPSPSPEAIFPLSPPAFSPPTMPPGLGVETGSNLGIGTDPRTSPVAGCARWAVLTVDYTYDPVEEEWTSADVGIESNLERPPSTADLADAGITTSSLLGEDGTARLADAIGALPMIVAEHGGAPVVPEATAATPPRGDQVAGPGIGRYVWMGLAIVLIIGGLLWIAVATVRSRRQESPHV